MITVIKHIECAKGVVVNEVIERTGMVTGFLTKEQYEQDQVDLKVVFGEPKKMMRKVENQD